MSNKALKGLTIKIGGDTTDLQKSLESVESKSQSISKELGEINKLLKLDPSNTELLAQKQKVLAEAISNTENKLETLKEAEKQVQAQFERGEVSEAQYRALQREIIETENKLGKYKNAAKETADTQENLAKGAGKAGKELDNAGESSVVASEKFNTAEVAAAALAAAIVATGKAAIDAFHEVDDGANNVIRATGAAGTSAKELTKVYKSVAANVVGSFEDIGATVGEVNTRFGYTGDRLEAVSTDFMKFAEITGVNSTEAVKSVTRALNDSGVPLDNYKELLDQLAKAGQSAGIDVTKLAEGLSTNGATMRNMGLDTAESIALLAQFELSGADATTMLSGMKKAMATWAKEGKNGNQEFEKLVKGVKSGSVSAADALEVFGTRAGPQLVDAIKSGKFEYQGMLETLRESEGTLEATFGELEDGGYSVQRSFQRLKIISGDLGEEILEATAPALEELLDYITETGAVKKFGRAIQNDIMPAIKNISSWVKNNGPLIKSTLVGVTAALVAYKVATVAAEVAHKGLKVAIMETTAAQKALELAKAATPWGLVATAVAGLTVAMMAYTAATRDAKEPVDILTEEERELMAAAAETADAFREQQKATQDTMASVSVEIGNVQKMADELLNLADASGSVLEKDRKRADFLLGRLNEALGTEYAMVDGVIQKYDELEQSIQDLIQAKLAEGLLEAGQSNYIEAQQQQLSSLAVLQDAKRDYYHQLDQYHEREKQYAAEIAELEAKKENAIKQGSQYAMISIDAEITKKKNALQTEKDILAAKKTAYDDAASNYSNYANTIIDYEAAQQMAIEGNYDAVSGILLKKGASFGEYSDKVDKETANVLDDLQLEAIQAGMKARNFRRNFEKGVNGYTLEMVKEAEKGYTEALDKFANAYADAAGFGEDLAEGMTDGAERKRFILLEKARSLVAGFLSAARDEADTHSPSKKTIKIFEDIGEGAVIGTDNKTDDLEQAANRQVSAVLDTYSAQEITGQKALRNVAETQASQMDLMHQTLATSNSDVLGKILDAILAGQVLMMDGDTVVGGTIGRINRKLGIQLTLTERGAL